MDIFISYADEDKTLSIKLEDRLKSHGIIVHRDKTDLRFGNDWREKLFQKIKECDKFILFWSIHSAKSNSVYEEVGEALKYNKLIVPCLLDETTLIPILENKHWFKLRDFETDLQIILTDLTLDLENFGDDEAIDITNALITYKHTIRKKFANLQVLFPDSEKPIADSYLELSFKHGLFLNNSKGELSTKKLFDLLVNSDEDYIVAGHPGTGKTSTLHYILHYWSNSQENALFLFARIRDYDPNFHSSLEEFIKEKFFKTLERRRVIEIFTNSDIFNSYKCVVLLDGLDEVKAGFYETFLKHLNEFKSKHRNSNVVLTTRIDGFRDKREVDFSGWTKYSIVKLDIDKIKEFLSNWFHNPEKELRLLKKLENPRLFELAGRAFLLALISLVFDEDEEKLGNNRSALYQQATHYLEKDRLGRLIESIIQLRRKVLKETALRFLQLNETELPEKLVLSFAENIVPNDFKEPIKTFLDEIVTDTGILQSYGDNYAFTHKSFQEYYAASALHDSNSGKDTLIAFCEVAQWEETVRLYGGLISNAQEQEKFISELWKKNPALALRTATECNQLTPSFLATVIKNSSPENRLRMIQEVNDSLRTMDTEDAKRLTVETLRPLFKIEHDSAVLYFGIQLLKEFDPFDSGKIMYETFYKDRDSLLQELQEDKKYKFELVEIKAGEFIMGDDASGEKYEKPEHKVKLDSFKICRFQLTNLAYELIMGTAQSKREESVSEEDDTPVVNLSWYDAYVCAYKVGCRLPTEAEWEFMARAGTTTKWCFGNDVNLLKDYANYVYDVEKINSSTWKVETGKANTWGIYDVHGNVWEWCQDWFGEYSNSRQENPTGVEHGTSKVRRGGGHAYHALGCRCAFRWGNDPSYKFKDIGVRFAR